MNGQTTTINANPKVKSHGYLLVVPGPDFAVLGLAELPALDPGGLEDDVGVPVGALGPQDEGLLGAVGVENDPKERKQK